MFKTISVRRSISMGEVEDTRTPEQVRVLRQLVERFHAYFPDTVIPGHLDLNLSKKSPSFDAVCEYWDLRPVR